MASLLLIVAGCHVLDNRPELTGSMAMKQQDFDLTGFSQLVIAGPIHTVIYQTGKSYVSVIMNENLLPYLQVNQTTDVLSIELNPKVGYKNLEIDLTIGLPSLRALSISNAGYCYMNGFNSKEAMDISVLNASELELSIFSAPLVSLIEMNASVVNGSMNCDEVKATVFGASRLDLKGQCEDMILDAAGASQVNMADYWVNSASVTIRGASSGSLSVGGKLNIDLSGASNFTYSGDPALETVRVAAGSKLIRR
jgi:hypothetical protein